MKNATIASLFLSAIASTSAFATGIDVRFSGACENGHADIAETDVEYSDLNLDLLDGKTSAECIITTTIAGRPGVRVNVSDFKAEATSIVDNNGIAVLTVGHRFNNTQELVNRDIAKYQDKDLVAAQTAVGFSECGQSVILRTKITTKAVHAVLLQDQANSSFASYKIGYSPCH